MPPASLAVTFAWRMVSSREVLPWSTWPITTTTGALETRFSSSSSLSSIIRSSMVTTTSFSTFAWNSIATSDAVSKSITSLTVTMVPIINSFLMTSAAVAFRRSANSLTAISSGMDTVIGLLLRSAAILLRRSASVSLRELRGLPLCWERCVIFCFWTVFSVLIFSEARRSYSRCTGRY